MFRYYATDIVNVRMIITEEKILSNIDKIQKLINPNNKKQIIALAQDKNFKELIDSVKTYIEEYPNKKTFPNDVYVEAFKLVQFATAQFEYSTKQVENLIRKREENMILAGIVKEVVNLATIKRPEFKDRIKQSLLPIPNEILQFVYILYKSKNPNSQEYLNAIANLKAQVANLESNAHISVDIERLDDRIKALSLIGVGLATQLKTLPLTEDKIKAVKTAYVKLKAEKENTQTQKPVVKNTGNQILKGQVPKVNYEQEKNVVPNANVPVQNAVNQMQYYPPVNTQSQIPAQNVNYQMMQKSKEQKLTLWQKFKNSKFVKAIKFFFNIRVVVELPKALPEGRG